MKLKFITPLIIGLLFTGCNSDSDVLAKYKNGNILRKDVRLFYKIYNLDKNPQSGSVEFQNSVIQEIALQNIVFEKFKGTSGQDFETIKDLTMKQYQISLFREDIMEQNLKNNEISMADVQLMVLNQEKAKNAQELLNKLNAMSSERKIAEFISENTDEASRKCLGGLLEPLCLNCGEDPIQNILEEGIRLKDAKFHLATAGANNYIYRISHINQIKSNEIEPYIKNRFKKLHNLAKDYVKTHNDEKSKQAASYYTSEQFMDNAKATFQHYNEKISRTVWNNEFENLKKDSGIKVNEEFMKGKIDNPSILYTDKSGKNYTYADLTKEFEKVSVLNKNKSDIQKDRLAFFYQLLLPYTIISASPKFQKVGETDLFKQGKNLLEKSVFWKFKQKVLMDEPVVIQEQQMREMYEAGKMYAYSTQDKNGKRFPMPYESVRERIKSELEKNLKSKKVQELVENLKKEYSLEILTKELKPNKV